MEITSSVTALCAHRPRQPLFLFLSPLASKKRRFFPSCLQKREPRSRPIYCGHLRLDKDFEACREYPIGFPIVSRGHAIVFHPENASVSAKCNRSSNKDGVEPSIFFL